MKRINLIELKKLIETLPKKDLLILDVRTESEYHQMHIQHSVNIPLAELKDKKNSLLGYNTIAVHCAHGFRARQGAELLLHLDFPNVMYVDGNIEDWVSIGLDVIKSYH